MIIDMHTHFFSRKLHFRQHLIDDMERCHIEPTLWDITPEDHMKATSAADFTVVFGLKAKKTGWQIPNEFVHEHVLRAPERLIFFASVDPLEPDFMDDLDHCHHDLGCRGVKIGPVYQGVHPLDERYRQIYAYCQREALPIMVHMGTTFSSGVPLEYARPAHMDQVAVDFPELKIVIAHLGHPWEGETIAAIRKQPNLFADLSALYYRPWQFYNSMRLLVEYGAQDNVLFGSDYPATTTESSIQNIRKINDIIRGTHLPPIPLEIIEEIIHRDSLSLLGMK